jgi:hypothetical protein
MPGSVWDNRADTDLHYLAHPILLSWDSKICCRARGCSAKRVRCNANASNDRYFPRVPGDIRLRDGQDARREHIPPPGRNHQCHPGKRRNADR